MVAYAYAAQFPEETEQLVLMDAFLPGVDGWEMVYNNPAIWHFRFNGSTPEALVRGRERVYFDHFWNNFAADKNRSLSWPTTLAFATPIDLISECMRNAAVFISRPSFGIAESP